MPSPAALASPPTARHTVPAILSWTWQRPAPRPATGAACTPSPGTPPTLPPTGRRRANKPAAPLPPSTQACPSPEARRAARLAWHTDDRGLRRGVLSGRLHGPALEARLHAVADGCKQATERLRTLRLRRELAAWELDYALGYALTLCGFDGTAYHAPAFPVPVPG